MKYYAVTDDPRELYHYGVKGMKWGQHIFGDKPKSPGYHKALGKLRASAKKATKATTSSLKTVGKAVQKSASQMLYNARAAQEKRLNKAVERSQKRYDKIDQKIDNYYSNVKPVKDARKQVAKAIVKSASNQVKTAVKNAPGQISYAVKRKQQEQYLNAVKKAQDRNKLSDVLRSLDKEEVYRKKADRDRKMEELHERQSNIMADNDLKTLSKAVKVEKNMPKYYQQAREGTLKYGQLSDEQIGRLQNRLALEAQTRRLGSTEAPSWRQQKKMARREGYLQGITKGVAAGMEEVGRASVQYGIKAIANRSKLNSKAKQEGKRENVKNRERNKKTHKDIVNDVKQESYEAQVRAGVGVLDRSTINAKVAAGRLQKANERLAQQKRISDNKNEREVAWNNYLTENNLTEKQALKNLGYGGAKNAAIDPEKARQKAITTIYQQKKHDDEIKRLNDEVYRKWALGGKNENHETMSTRLAKREEMHDLIYGQPKLNTPTPKKRNPTPKKRNPTPKKRNAIQEKTDKINSSIIDLLYPTNSKPNLINEEEVNNRRIQKSINRHNKKMNKKKLNKYVEEQGYSIRRMRG